MKKIMTIKKIKVLESIEYFEKNMILKRDILNSFEWEKIFIRLAKLGFENVKAKDIELYVSDISFCHILFCECIISFSIGVRLK